MAERHPRSKIRTALVGVGNCASSLIQGLHYYGGKGEQTTVDGLMNPVLGGYHVDDIGIVAAFDINETKVGSDVADAIFARPNNAARFASVPAYDVRVTRGPTLDGLGHHLQPEIVESGVSPAGVTKVLRDAGAEIVVCYLPVGSQLAAEHYAASAIEAGCAFINCMPAKIASDRAWAERFKSAGVPVIGDDVKSQVGATILHRMLAKLFEDRGAALDRTFQFDFGGNADFKNMLEFSRKTSKQASKTNSVVHQLDRQPNAGNVHISPSDHVAWLEDQKLAYIRLEGRGFANMPVSLELKLEVSDSPNSAGIVVDAIRCAKLCLERGLKGAIEEPSCYLMKSPPQQIADQQAKLLMEAFIHDQ